MTARLEVKLAKALLERKVKGTRQGKSSSWRTEARKSQSRCGDRKSGSNNFPVNEAVARAINTLEEWKAFLEADTLNKEVNVVTLNEVINFIVIKVPNSNIDLFQKELERSDTLLEDMAGAGTCHAPNDDEPATNLVDLSALLDYLHVSQDNLHLLLNY